ncbi:undecaprenyl-phosphate glucose phosphotransferase [Parvibium lacunae]|uniref:Undecaprenyl-phosphate glucose phosphotransferase n=1 Tax=Parvibium lacunae TaxID=1888893 RepID=A0A368L160_9BURK|nr:undecaprenyl-phosphate glucose phosphotransferase [Parvibium lacunae]RCS57054.1 undecaprenyl-phosphate glucose phosphotransferase [Parvibium lacunae]
MAERGLFGGGAGLSRTRTHTTNHEFFAGMTFTLITCLTLSALVGIHDLASLQAFSTTFVITLLACLASYFRPNAARVLGAWDLGKTFPLIVGRWLWVYFTVLMAAYLSKSAEELSRMVMLTWLFVNPLALLLSASILRFLLGRYYQQSDRRRRAILLSSNSATADFVAAIQQTPLADIDLQGFYDNREQSRPPSDLRHLGSLEEAIRFFRRMPAGEPAVDVVFIALTSKERPELSELIELLQDSTISTYFLPESRLFGLPGIQISELAGKPVLVASETPLLGLAAMSKRLFDIIVASVAIVLLSPVMLVLAIATKLSSPGPILYKQVRYGMGGKPILVYKFRSMYQQAANAPVIQATAQDKRVTRLGWFMRRTSLDELPQFLNVLFGSMSIVGPRPHAVEHNEMYRKLVQGYMLRHKVKPGITGWAQVNGWRGETDTLEKMQKRIEYDLQYIQNWSLWLDCVILIKTVRVVFGQKNAY